jgi:hypothetical protein
MEKDLKTLKEELLKNLIAKAMRAEFVTLEHVRLVEFLHYSYPAEISNCKHGTLAVMTAPELA